MIFFTIHGRILAWMMLCVSTTCQLISYANSSSRSCNRGKMEARVAGRTPDHASNIDHTTLNKDNQRAADGAHAYLRWKYLIMRSAKAVFFR